MKIVRSVSDLLTMLWERGIVEAEKNGHVYSVYMQPGAVGRCRLYVDNKLCGKMTADAASEWLWKEIK
jgi:hypothetical protein